MKTAIFWCTGLSGAGKSTLANGVADKLKRLGKTVLIIDGDDVREKYPTKLSYGRADVEVNNLNVTRYCENEIGKYDCIIVPIISPIDEVRKKIRSLLSPNFYLVYIAADIQVLRLRDTKGLYAKADAGELQDLIGYSESNPYDIPDDCNLIVDTSNSADPQQSIDMFYDYAIEIIC